MAIFTIWGKAAPRPDKPVPVFERFCEINQIAVAGTDDTRNQLAALIASRWLEANGNGIIEFRDVGGVVLIRLTQP